MSRRGEERFRKRIPCKIKRSRSTFSGMIVDVSRQGMFVQTSAAATAGDEIDITLSGRPEDPVIVLNAQVVWRRQIPYQLRTIAEGGLGLKIRFAPEQYYQILAEAAQASASGPRRAV
jgi:Tfp pilus assembly protein PilZ